MIFTGAHDGSLFAWHFETGFAKYTLHEKDPTCMSKDHVRDSKSLDSLIIMQKERLLLSGSCDGKIRFWDIKDLSSEKCMIYCMNVFNYSWEEDQLTCMVAA